MYLKANIVIPKIEELDEKLVQSLERYLWWLWTYNQKQK
jgi:hypothetical protein